MVEALEMGTHASSTITDAIREREADLHRVERELDRLADMHMPPLAVIPTWVRQQLTDLTSLLGESPDRVKQHFHRMGMSVTVTSAGDCTRPYLQATCVGDLLPTSCALVSSASATERLHPRAAP